MIIRFPINGTQYDFFHDNQWIYFNSKIFNLSPKLYEKKDVQGSVLAKYLHFNWNGEDLFIGTDGRVYYPNVYSPTDHFIVEPSIGNMEEIRLTILMNSLGEVPWTTGEEPSMTLPVIKLPEEEEKKAGFVVPNAVFLGLVAGGIWYFFFGGRKVVRKWSRG